MEFLGPVTKYRGELVRPHDVDVFTSDEAGSSRAIVRRLHRVGFEVRAELRNGEDNLFVHLNRGQVDALGISEGSDVWIRPAAGASSVVTG